MNPGESLHLDFLTRLKLAHELASFVTLTVVFLITGTSVFDNSPAANHPACRIGSSKALPVRRAARSD